MPVAEGVVILFNAGGESVPRKSYEDIERFEFDDKIHAFVALGLEWNRQMFGRDTATFVYDDQVGEWAIALGPLWSLEDPDTLSLALFYAHRELQREEKVAPQWIDLVEFNMDAFREDVESILRQPSRSSAAVITRTPSGMYTADNPAQATEIVNRMADTVSGEALDQIRIAAVKGDRGRQR